MHLGESSSRAAALGAAAALSLRSRWRRGTRGRCARNPHCMMSNEICSFAWRKPSEGRAQTPLLPEPSMLESTSVRGGGRAWTGAAGLAGEESPPAAGALPHLRLSSAAASAPRGSPGAGALCAQRLRSRAPRLSSAAPL